MSIIFIRRCFIGANSKDLRGFFNGECKEKDLNLLRSLLKKIRQKAFLDKHS
jgi:hypothetical protein